MITAEPIIEELSLAYPPEIVFEVFKDQPHSIFLDSGMDCRGVGRFSFLVADPYLIFKSKHRKIEIAEGAAHTVLHGNPLHLLKGIIAEYRLAPSPQLPAFTGGAVGYFGYDLGWQLERLPTVAVDDMRMSDIHLGFYDWVLIFDHRKKTWYIASTGFPKQTARGRRIRARERIRMVTSKLRRGGGLPAAASSSPWPGKRDEPLLVSNFTKREYLQAVATIKRHIACGDIYQANLSQRFTAALACEPYRLYKRLRTINPAPFAAFLNLGDEHIISASPEQFLRIADSDVTTRPIKGTRPRGETAATDRRLKAELLSSKKDRAELVMIVDLERNDLGKVCDYGSINVDELITLERYATVFHLVATVRGKLHRDKDHIDCIRACFPGGSITGAPKIRAMEILEGLERTRRGIYTGSIGYLGFNRQTNLNIVIRTIIAKNGRIYFNVGGGIVADSDPESEYQETLHKARALITALSYADVRRRHVPDVTVPVSS